MEAVMEVLPAHLFHQVKDIEGIAVFQDCLVQNLSVKKTDQVERKKIVKNRKKQSKEDPECQRLKQQVEVTKVAAMLSLLTFELDKNPSGLLDSHLYEDQKAVMVETIQ